MDSVALYILQRLDCRIFAMTSILYTYCSDWIIVFLYLILLFYQQFSDWIIALLHRIPWLYTHYRDWIMALFAMNSVSLHLLQ